MKVYLAKQGSLVFMDGFFTPVKCWKGYFIIPRRNTWKLVLDTT